MKTYTKYYIGKVMTNKQGYKFKIIDYGYKKYRYKIKFLDEYGYEKDCGTTSIVTGAVENPYAPTIYNKACLGAGHYSIKTHKRHYNKWRAMIDR